MSTAIRGRVFRFAVLFWLFLGCACDDRGPSPFKPTPPSTPVTPAPTPVPPPSWDLSPFLGVWNLSLRVTDVKGGGGCPEETLQAQSGVPQRYSLTVTTGSVTITNPAGDYACNFSGSFKTDDSSFTTYRQPGYFTCQEPLLTIRCHDGTVHNLFSWGQDISRRLSGSEMTGTWAGVWTWTSAPVPWVEVTMQFTGRK